MRWHLRYTVGLFASGVLVHAAVLWVAHGKTGAVDGYALRSLDCGEYYNIARNLVEHGVFSQSEAAPFEPDTWRTPGYPLFLAAAMLLFGKSPVALILVQQFFCLLNVLLVFRAAREWMSESRAAIAAVLLLLEPYHLYYSLWLLSTTWLVTLILIAWITWSKAIRNGALLHFGLLGGLCGFLVLTWPGAFLVPLAVFVGIIVSCAQRQQGNPAQTNTGAIGVSSQTPLPRPLAFEGRTVWGRLLRGGSVFVIICALVIGLWMLRNERIAGHFALSHQSGIVLTYFKATEVDLWRQGRTADRYLETSLSTDRRDQPHSIWESIDETLRGGFHDLPIEKRKELTWSNLAQGNKTSVDGFRISAELKSIAFGKFLESPLSTLAACFARCASILTFPLDLALWPPKGVEVNRLRSVALGGLYFVLVLGVVIRLVRRRVGFSAVYFPLACALALLLATTPQTDPRFRVPMIPLLIVVALLPNRRVTHVDRDPDRRASTTGESDRQTKPC